MSLKPTIEERFEYIEEINRLETKTWEHIFGAFIGTVLTLMSAVSAGMTMALVGFTATAVGIIALCVAVGAFGIWYAAPWFSYHAALSKLINDWESKYGDE